MVVPADLALGRVPGREAQDEQVSALVAQVSQVLERAVWDDQKSVQMAQEDRVQVLQVQDGQVSELVAQVNRALAQVAQDDRVSVPESQVGQVLARAVWDDQKSVQKAPEDRVQALQLQVGQVSESESQVNRGWCGRHRRSSKRHRHTSWCRGRRCRRRRTSWCRGRRCRRQWSKVGGNLLCPHGLARRATSSLSRWRSRVSQLQCSRFC